MTVDQHQICADARRCTVRSTKSCRHGLLLLVVIVWTMAACDSSAGRQTESGSSPAPVSITGSQASSTGSGDTNSREPSGVVVAVDARTGRQRWRTALPMATVSAPVVSGELVVVVGVYDCNATQMTVAALQSTTGRLVWQRAVATQNPCAYDVPLHVTAGIVVAGGRLGDSGPGPGRCALSGPAAAGPRAVGLDLKTGQQRWQEPTAAALVLAATSDTLIARGARQGCLVGLDPATGRLRWTVTPAVSPIFAAATADSAFLEGQVAGGAAAVSAVDPRTGHKQWQAAVPPDPTGGMGPLAVGDVVVAGTRTTIGLDPATGRQMWRADEHGDTRNTTAPGLLLVGHLSGSHYAVEARDPRTGVRRWQSASFEPSIGIALAVTDGAVVVALRLRSTAGFNAADGHPLWTVPGVFADAAVTADAAYLTTPTTPKNPPQGD